MALENVMRVDNGKIIGSGASEKTFSGTAAEWAALSTAQKKAYDFADITNDYDEAAIGNMAALHTTDKSSIVGAINEVKDEILEDPADFIGTQEAWNALSLAEKTSHTKANITNDFEEAAIGNLSALTTTNKSSVVGAINEVKSGLTNIGSNTDLGNVQGSDTITLSDSVSNYRFIQILIGYYASGYPCFGQALLPVSTLFIGADDVPITVAFTDRTGTISGKADILFLSATSVKVVNTSDAVYTRIVGIA